MRDICLLHCFDAAPVKARPIPDVLNGEGPLAWSEVQLLLHTNIKDLLPYLTARGRLSKEQHAFLIEAVPFLNRRSEEGPHGLGTYAVQSIYDLVWYMWATAHDDWLFRGQYRAEWPLDCTLLRAGSAGLSVGELLARTSRTEDFCQKLRGMEHEYFHRDLTNDERLAVAQHFGMPTPLMDFTRSLSVAAFFATLSARHMKAQEPVCGAIYMLRARQESDTPDPGRLIGIPLLDLLGLRVGHIHVVEPNLPDGDDRIRRQQGVFVRGFNPRDINSYIVDRKLFWQVPGEVYEDPTQGVVEAQLLPPSTPLARLAADISAARAAGGTDSLWDTPLPNEGVIGSAGSLLTSQLDETERFFRGLLDTLGDAVVRQHLTPLLLSYFTRVSSERLVGTLPQGGTSESADCALFPSIMDLAEWSGLNSRQLWNHLVPQLPSQWDSGGPRPVPPPPLQTLEQHAALACALFLAGWEHVRHVDGHRARTLMADGWLVLDQSKFRLGG